MTRKDVPTPDSKVVALVTSEEKPSYTEDEQKHFAWTSLQCQAMTIIAGKGTSIQKGLVEDSSQIRWV